MNRRAYLVVIVGIALMVLSMQCLFTESDDEIQTGDTVPEEEEDDEKIVEVIHTGILLEVDLVGEDVWKIVFADRVFFIDDWYLMGSTRFQSYELNTCYNLFKVEVYRYRLRKCD